MSEKNVEDIPVVVGTLEYTSLKFKEYVELHFANAIYICLIGYRKHNSKILCVLGPCCHLTGDIFLVIKGIYKITVPWYIQYKINALMPHQFYILMLFFILIEWLCTCFILLNCLRNDYLFCQDYLYIMQYWFIILKKLTCTVKLNRSFCENVGLPCRVRLKKRHFRRNLPVQTVTEDVWNLTSSKRLPLYSTTPIFCVKNLS